MSVFLTLYLPKLPPPPQRLLLSSWEQDRKHIYTTTPSTSLLRVKDLKAEGEDK